jgi:hypothetical protein
VSEKLVLNTFATLILFEDLYEEFSGAIEAMLREDDG